MSATLGFTVIPCVRLTRKASSWKVLPPTAHSFVYSRWYRACVSPARPDLERFCHPQHAPLSMGWIPWSNNLILAARGWRGASQSILWIVIHWKYYLKQIGDGPTLDPKFDCQSFDNVLFMWLKLRVGGCLSLWNLKCRSPKKEKY